MTPLPGNPLQWMDFVDDLLRVIAQGKKTLGTIREILARESPESLAAFDARVAAAGLPWQQADDLSRKD